MPLAEQTTILLHTASSMTASKSAPSPNDDPIKTPDGKTLRTLKDAAEYVLALPKKVQAEPAWQRAALLSQAGERLVKRSYGLLQIIPRDHPARRQMAPRARNDRDLI